MDNPFWFGFYFGLGLMAAFAAPVAVVFFATWFAVVVNMRKSPKPTLPEENAVTDDKKYRTAWSK